MKTASYPKTCIKCAQVKERFDYPKHGGAQCRECCRPYIRDYKDSIRTTLSKNRIEARIWIYEYLKLHPCVHCGESNPITLEFHHIGPKRFTIAAYLSSGRSGLFKDGKLVGIDMDVPNTHPLRVLIDEIAQCEVICRNCHAWTTAKERNTFRYRQWSLDNGGMGN